MKDCEPLILPALKQSIYSQVSIEEDGEACRVTLPFERADNDAVTLWVEERGDKYIITDKSETYGMLYLSNINLDQERRARRLRSTSDRYDLEIAKDEIRLIASEEELGDRLLDAVQAVQSISNLVLTRQQYTQYDFYDDVNNYLDQYEFEYHRNVKVVGAAQEHRVDYEISADRPTYLEALHAESVSSSHAMAKRTAYKWTDIGKKASEAYRISVLDDESGKFDERTTTVLQEYSDAFVQWSQRDQLTDALAHG